MDIKNQLRKLNITLPVVKLPDGLPLVPGVITGNLIFMSGHTPTVNGVNAYIGTLGGEISIEEAQEAIRIATLNCISQIEKIIGDLNLVKRIVKLTGFVASENNFTDQAAVVNAASNLLIDIFGEKGKHARSAVGVFRLPGGVPVEVELIIEI